MKSTLGDSNMIIESTQDDGKYDGLIEPGCGVIDSCRVTHCLCRICTVAPWCGTDCKSCSDKNFTERKIKCKDFCPDKYMINYMRQLDEEDDMIISDRVSMKILSHPAAYCKQDTTMLQDIMEGI